MLGFSSAADSEVGLAGSSAIITAFVRCLLRYYDLGPADVPTNMVAEAPWSVAEWAVAPRFDNPRATVLVLVLG